MSRHDRLWNNIKPMQPHCNTQPLARWRHSIITKWRVSKWLSWLYNSCDISADLHRVITNRAAYYVVTAPRAAINLVQTTTAVTLTHSSDDWTWRKYWKFGWVFRNKTDTRRCSWCHICLWWCGLLKRCLECKGLLAKGYKPDVTDKF